MLRRIGRLFAPQEVPAWDRGKLLLALAGLAFAAVALVAGLVLAVDGSLNHRHRAETAARPSTASAPASSTAPGNHDAATDVQARADALATAPLPAVGPDAAQPATVSTRNPGTIVLPNPTSVGPANVPSGFPHTVAGAIAQLAAIDQTALQTTSMAGVREVIAHWAAPGGPTAQTWSGVAAMAGFLTSAGLSGGGSPQLALVATPLMGLVKGAVGADVAVVCVDFELDATLTQTNRVADADCQKMVWQTGRWVIGPGAEPAAAPSVWPDTDTAISVGYQDLRHG